MAHKDIDRLDLPDGYTLAVSGTQHLTVICPDGEPLRMPNGVPVTCALTPGTDRTRTIEASRIRRALRSGPGSSKSDKSTAEAGDAVEPHPGPGPEAKRDKPPRSHSRRKPKGRIGGKVAFMPLPDKASRARGTDTRRETLCQVERRCRAALKLAGMTRFEREAFTLWKAMRR